MVSGRILQIDKTIIYVKALKLRRLDTYVIFAILIYVYGDI